MWVFLKESPLFHLPPPHSITPARKRSFIRHPKSAFHSSTNFFYDCKPQSPARNYLTFIYFVFSPYFLLMAEWVSVWAQHLCPDSDYMRLRDDLQVQAGWQEKMPSHYKMQTARQKYPHICTRIWLHFFHYIRERNSLKISLGFVCLNEPKKEPKM